MKREVHAIPPAPRRIRMRPLFAHRWPLLAIGGTLVVIGGLLAWLMFLQSGGKMSDGLRLDRQPKAVVDGRVTSVRPATWDGVAGQDIVYTFQHTLDGTTTNLHGSSFVPGSDRAVGQTVQVEVLAEDPNVSRISGGLLQVDRAWLRAQFWILAMTVPGTLVLLGWLASVFQLRHVLVHGDVAVGRVTGIRPVAIVLPEMLRVDYVFRDHRAKDRRNHHWVRVHGALGARLLAQLRREQYEDMPVLHDRRLPQWNRMLLPQDFLPHRSTTAAANAHS